MTLCALSSAKGMDIKMKNMILSFVQNARMNLISIFIPVSKQDLVVIAPKNHPLSGHESINLKELAPYPQIYFSQASGLRGIVDNLFQKNTGEAPDCV